MSQDAGATGRHGVKEATQHLDGLASELVTLERYTILYWGIKHLENYKHS
jgi:hypothetical protein